MRVLIVEDEELAAEKIQKMVSDVEPSAVIAGITGSIVETVDWLSNNSQPDLILMDIELSDGQSFEIFNQAKVDCEIIFTTSYDEFALKAFRVNSIDYLLKPILKADLARAFAKFSRLRSAGPQTGDMRLSMQKFLEQLRLQSQPKEYRKRFLVKSGQKHIPIETATIAYFFVHERVVFFKTMENKKFIVDYTLDEVANMLDPQAWFRVNRSVIISVGSVHQLHDYVNSRLLLSLNPPSEEAVIVSREKVNEFKSWVGK